MDAAESADSFPGPRAHHLAAVVEEDVFISSGMGPSGRLHELWRRRNRVGSSAGGDWVHLASGAGATLASSGGENAFGAVVLISPWGIMSVAGMVENGGVGFAAGAWVLDPADRRWRMLWIKQEYAEDRMPAGRFKAAAAVLSPSAAARTLGRVPGLLLFGGQDEWRKLDDLWELQLNSVPTTLPIRPNQTENSTTATEGILQVSASRPHQHGSWEAAEMVKKKRCEHVIAAGTSNDTWHAACGGSEAKGRRGRRCTLNAVLERAWCLGEYQVIGSP